MNASARAVAHLVLIRLAMNVFQFSAITSPIAGAVAGAQSLHASSLWMAAGAGIGFIAGLALYFASLGLSHLIVFRVRGVHTKNEGLTPLEWLASFGSVFVIMLAPFAAWAASAHIVPALLHP